MARGKEKDLVEQGRNTGQRMRENARRLMEPGFMGMPAQVNARKRTEPGDAQQINAAQSNMANGANPMPTPYAKGGEVRRAEGGRCMKCGGKAHGGPCKKAEGGRASHEDEAQDRSLFKRMFKQEESQEHREGKAKGGHLLKLKKGGRVEEDGEEEEGEDGEREHLKTESKVGGFKFGLGHSDGTPKGKVKVTRDHPDHPEAYGGDGVAGMKRGGPVRRAQGGPARRREPDHEEVYGHVGDGGGEPTSPAYKAKGGSMKPGGGGRFAKLKASIAKRGGVSDPGAVAAAIGRKKYGAAKMAKWSAAGRKRAEGGRAEDDGGNGRALEEREENMPRGKMHRLAKGGEVKRGEDRTGGPMNYGPTYENKPQGYAMGGVGKIRHDQATPEGKQKPPKSSGWNAYK